MKSLVLRPLAFAAAWLAAGAAQAATYVSVAAGSELAFEGHYDGEAFLGTFKTFTSTVAFDPADLAATKIDAAIDVASVDTENEERDDTLAGSEFFDTAKFPKATFSATGCTGKAPTLACRGSLTIRDQTHAVPFPVTFTENPDGSARLEAAVTIRRTAFDVGTGDWADTGAIADEVKVTVDVTYEKP